MIILVSSPKKHLPKDMQHSVSETTLSKKYDTAVVCFAEDNFPPFFMLKKIGKLQCDSIVYTIASKLDILNCV